VTQLTVTVTYSTYLFGATIPVDSGKTVASVTLPFATGNGSIGIFVIAAG